MNGTKNAVCFVHNVRGSSMLNKVSRETGESQDALHGCSMRHQ